MAQIRYITISSEIYDGQQCFARFLDASGNTTDLGQQILSFEFSTDSEFGTCFVYVPSVDNTFVVQISDAICPTPTPTTTSTPTPTPTTTETSTPTPTVTETPTNTPTTTETPTNTPTETPTNTPSETPTNTPTPSITASPGQTPTATETPTPTQTETPTNTPSETPTLTPTTTETPTPTPSLPDSNFLLQENYSMILQQDGFGILIQFAGPTPTPTNTPSPTPPDVLIDPILVGVDEYLIVGNNEYLKY